MHRKLCLKCKRPCLFRQNWQNMEIPRKLCIELANLDSHVDFAQFPPDSLYCASKLKLSKKKNKKSFGSHQFHGSRGCGQPTLKVNWFRIWICFIPLSESVSARLAVSKVPDPDGIVFKILDQGPIEA